MTKIWGAKLSENEKNQHKTDAKHLLIFIYLFRFAFLLYFTRASSLTFVMAIYDNLLILY